MKTCFIMNFGPHYRFPIYSAIGNTFNVEMFFGDHLRENIKSMDYNRLPSFGGVLHNFFIGPFYWQCGAVSKIYRRSYSQFVMVGDVYCLSTWVILLLTCLMPSKKTCLWTHGLYGSENLFQHIVKLLFYKLSDKLLVYNDFSISNMIKAGIKGDKMMCIANSLDSETEKTIRERMGDTTLYTYHFNNDNPVIIYCGRIQKRKRLDVLVEALLFLNEERIHSNIVIVGKDDDGVNLEEQVREKGVESQVWFYGPCYDDEKLAELFYNANVCVSPGNVGLTAIHSLTFGCPVVTHNDFTMQMPEFEAIQDGVTGSFFEMNNIQSLVQALKPWLIKGKKDREQVRQAAFAEIDRKWNVDHQISVLSQIL